MLFVKEIKQPLSSTLDRKGIPLSCVVLSVSPVVEIQEFVHSLSYLIHVFPNQVDNLSRMRKTDEQHDQIYF
jgi:hypothetical protein